MRTDLIEKAINDYITANSGFDVHRKYLGMSKISGCPRRAYLEYEDGVTADLKTHRMSFAGYEHEDSILKILDHIHLIAGRNVEVVAPFDTRFRGHLDAKTVDGALIEVKSVSAHRYANGPSRNRALHEHFVQVQIYMRYSGCGGAFIIYRCRETYEHKVIYLQYMVDQAERFEAQAKAILKAIDEKTPPKCECGRCPR